MLPPTLTFALALCLGDTAPVEPATTPKGTPPQIVIASLKGDILTLTETKMQYVTKQFDDTVKTPDGKVVKVLKTVTEAVPVMVQRLMNVKGATVNIAGGKKLTLADAEKRLSKPTALLLSGDGVPVDPGYLALFKSDTLVIVVPAGKTPAGTIAVPQPLPAPLPPPAPKE